MSDSDAPGPDRCPTGVLALIGADAGAVRDAMAANLPPGGIASTRLHRNPLLTATYRLLDSRILAAAVGCLDQDVAKPVAEWLSRYQNLRRAAATTLDDPAATETVLLKEPHRLAATRTSEVRLTVKGQQIAAFPFTVAITLDLGQTSVTLRNGAIEEVECVAATLAAALSFADVSPPLWERSAPDLELRLPVRPAVHVPLVPVPRGPAPVAGRPRPPAPVPGAAQRG
jgi:hypothetical protein